MNYEGSNNINKEGKERHHNSREREEELKCSLTSIPIITAPSARNSVMWLVRLKGPVSHIPGGTLSCPPPLPPNSMMASTAFSNAWVFNVTPSPTPPKSDRLKTVGRSRGHGLGGGARRRNNPRRPTAPLCHTTTAENSTVHSTARRVRCDRRATRSRRR